MSLYTNIFFNGTEERHDTVMFHCTITDSNDNTAFGAIHKQWTTA